jgi:hypothetical protein
LNFVVATIIPIAMASIVVETTVPKSGTACQISFRYVKYPCQNQ